MKKVIRHFGKLERESNKWAICDHIVEIGKHD